MVTERQVPERHAAASGEKAFDEEIRRRLVFATGMGILALTLVSMVLMWWLSGYLVEHVRSRDLPLTEVQEMRRRQLGQENLLRAQTETRVFPLLEFPGDASYPGGLVYDHEPYPPDPDVPAVPVVQVAPWIDMEAFLEEQRRIQESVGLDDPEGSPPKAHLPVWQVVDWFFVEHPKARRDYVRTFPYRPLERSEPGITSAGVTAAVESPAVPGGEGEGPMEDTEAGDAAARDAASRDATVGGSNGRSEESP